MALGKGPLEKHFKENIQINPCCYFTSLWHPYRKVFPGSSFWDKSQTPSPVSHILAGGHSDLPFHLLPLTRGMDELV
jgi:hypothetical protein